VDLKTPYKTVSSLYETEPWGFESEDKFLNAAVHYELYLKEGYNPEAEGLMILGICKEGSCMVSVISLQTVRKEQNRIIIDPGHGGVDGGATSCTGKLESTYNLEISLRLRDLFHLLGYPTYIIRTTDTSVYTKGDTIAAQKMSDLKERVRIVNQEDRSILISIHQNNFQDSRYSGAQVFYPETKYSRELAENLQSALVQSINLGSSRKVKKASGIYLMEHIQCPGILVECGFLSNPEEEAKLSSPGYQQKLCCVVAATVKQFIEKGYANT
jgi:N-acetylmuramoyl-L-alanine amidase